MRILYALIVSTVLISCEPQITDKSGGKWYQENPPQLSGQKFKIGSDEAAEMVVKVIRDFADMDKNESIIESMADSVNFYSPEGYQKLDMTTTETLDSIQEPYESIKRIVNRRSVFERFWVNPDGKISTNAIFHSVMVPAN